MRSSAVSLRHPAGYVSAAALASVLFLSGCTKQQPVQARQDPAPVQVKVAKVDARDVRRVVQSVGTFYPLDETVVSSEIEGRVTDVKVDLGDYVQKGQVLVRISDEEQRYLVAQTEAALRMALERVGLKGPEDKLKDVREASEVRRAQADLFDAEQRYNRSKSLLDQGIGSRSDYDQAQARFQAARAAYDQSVNTIRNLMQDIERQKAALELQRKKLRDTTIYAPFSGSVKERQVTPGTVVRPNTPLLTLVKNDPLRLRVEVPERMAPWIRNGQIVEVKTEAFTDRTLSGKVWRISPTVDQSKRTFIVEALVANPGHELKSGSFARASLPTNKVERVRTIPARAVAYVFGSNKAFVVRNGNTIESRDVKVGDRFEEEIEILEGLEEGDVVATSQLNRLDTGTKVAIGTGKGPGRAEPKGD